MRATTKRTVAKARALRRTMSQPEARLWQYLRTRPEGLKFRRQHPVGPYVLDFYCPAAKLAIEVDGEAHGLAERDLGRDLWLRNRGIDTLRIAAADLYGDIAPAVLHILSRCRA